MLNCVRACLFFCLLTLPFAAKAQDWKLEKDSDGVKVYTRRIEGWGLKEFRAVMQVKTSLKEVEALLRDAPARSQWMHNTINTRDIKGKSTNEVYSYSVIDVPWPATDRDNVTKMHFKYSLPKEFTVELTSADGIEAENDCCVRIPRMKGYWKAVDLGNGLIEITQQAVADTGGNIPDWMANGSVIDSPFNTLKNMKNRLEAAILSKKIFGN